MANLNDAIALAQSLLKEKGLAQQGWRVTLTRAKRGAGVCKYRTKQIGLSAYVIPAMTEDSAFNTITHEVSHAIAGHKAGHGYEWQRIHNELGGNAKRTYNDDSFIEGVKPDHLQRDRSKDATYKGVCPHGHISYRYKLKRGALYSCSVCSPRFDKRFLITFGLNQ